MGCWRIALGALILLASAGAGRAADDIDACQSDAMVVFDASGSMATSDLTLKEPRIAFLKRAMGRVLPEIAPLRRLGLIVYGEGDYNDCSSIALRMRPTANAAEPMLRIIRSINPRGRTPLTESVREAAETLDFTRREAVVVLVTDGEETCGQDPCQVAAALKKAGRDLTIHVIGYRDPQQQEYFNARCMADQTGGQYVSASNEDELVKALRKTLGCPFLTLKPAAPGPQFACAAAPPVRETRAKAACP
jgi:Ca-activated chloride channel family protein